MREFAQSEIAPRAAEIDRSDQFPMDVWRKFGELGVLGITVPEQYGGADMGYLAHIWWPWRKYRALCASVGLSHGAHSNLCMNQINRVTAAQAQKVATRPSSSLGACGRTGHERAGAGLTSSA